MLRCLLLFLLLASTAHAATSLRVGSQVLTIGDSAAHVQALLGEPTLRTFLYVPVQNLPDNQLAPAEQWQYTRDGKTEVITIVGGRVTRFDTLYE